MKKTPTTEQIIEKHYSLCTDEDGTKIMYFWEIKKAMVEFAELHVKAALESALESIPCLGSSSDIASYEEVKEEVLNAYPKENIK